jgi:hypothetical protein
VTLHVVGPGLGGRAPTPLKLALGRLLGGRCHHMAEVLADRERQLALWTPVLRGDDVDRDEVFAGFVAQVDDALGEQLKQAQLKNLRSQDRIAALEAQVQEVLLTVGTSSTQPQQGK